MFEVSWNIDPDATEAALVDQLAAMTRTTAGIAAAQARVTTMLEAKRLARRAAEGSLPPDAPKGWHPRWGWPASPPLGTGAKYLKMSRILVDDMPYTLAALQSGVLTENRAMIHRGPGRLPVTSRPTRDGCRTVCRP